MAWWISVTTWRSSTARRTTLSLAALCLFAQLSGLAHLAIVPHVTCAEHGELIEASASTSDWSIHSSSPGESFEICSVEPGLEAAAEHSHDHCAVTSMRRTPGCPLGPTSTEMSAPVEQPRRVGREPRVHTALPLLALAPKSSPPHA